MRAFIALIFLFLFTAGAAAQSCSALKSQLASAQAGKPNAAVVASLSKRARQFNCGAGGRAGRHHNCAAINAQLRQAKSGVVNRSRIRRINRQIAAHCGQPSRKATRQARRQNREGVRRNAKGNRRNIFSAIFGRDDGRNRDREFEVANVDPRGSRGVERIDLNEQQKRRSNASRSATGAPLATGSGRRGRLRVGSSRTMCVRLCDGFYFPINSRSHSDNYYEELAMCVGRCPGADVSLYVHYSGEAVERMRSTMTGEAYVNLPTAFDYRKKLRPGCGCTNGTQIVRGDGNAPSMSYASATPSVNTVTDTGKDNTRWTPFRAVYDGTGKPLRPSLTAYGAAPTTNVQVANEAAKARGTLPPPPVQTGEAAAASGPIAAVEFDVDDDTVREVGPQFFSRTVAQFSASKQESIRKRTGRAGVPTVITVTPLRQDPEESAAATTPVDDTADIPEGTSAMVVRDKSGG